MFKFSVKILVKKKKITRGVGILTYTNTYLTLPGPAFGSKFLSSASANILGLALLASHMLSDPGSPNEQGGLGQK